MSPPRAITHVWPCRVHVTATRRRPAPRAAPRPRSAGPSTIVYAIVAAVARVEHRPHRAALDDVGPRARRPATSRTAGTARRRRGRVHRGRGRRPHRDGERVVDRRPAAGDAARAAPPSRRPRRARSRAASGAAPAPATAASAFSSSTRRRSSSGAGVSSWRSARARRAGAASAAASAGSAAHAGLDLGAARAGRRSSAERDQVRLVLRRQVWVRLGHIPLSRMTPSAGARIPPGRLEPVEREALLSGLVHPGRPRARARVAARRAGVRQHRRSRARPGPARRCAPGSRSGWSATCCPARRRRGRPRGGARGPRGAARLLLANNGEPHDPGRAGRARRAGAARSAGAGVPARRRRARPARDRASTPRSGASSPPRSRRCSTAAGSG